MHFSNVSRLLAKRLALTGEHNQQPLNLLKEQPMIKRFFADETGLELSEYAVAAALVVAGVVVAFTTLGNAITTRLGTLSNTITG
jgi:Flp pilus assembly pilin Flp